MPSIKVKINKAGDVSMTVDGVKGESCRDLTKFLESSLGKVTKTENTGEYFEAAVDTDIDVSRG